MCTINSERFPKCLIYNLIKRLGYSIEDMVSICHHSKIRKTLLMWADVPTILCLLCFIVFFCPKPKWFTPINCKTTVILLAEKYTVPFSVLPTISSGTILHFVSTWNDWATKHSVTAAVYQCWRQSLGFTCGYSSVL